MMKATRRPRYTRIVGTVGDELVDRVLSSRRIYPLLPPKNNTTSMQPLSQGIIHDGGHFSVSSRMGMTPVSKKKGPKMSFADVVRGIREFNDANGVVGRFPSQKELREGDRCDLLYWARQYGMSEVSEYMGLRRAKGGRPALRSERDDP